MNMSNFTQFISNAQEEVSKHCTNEYYSHAYREAETGYWFELIQCLFDCYEGTVENCLDIGAAYGTLAVFLKRRFNANVYCTDFVSHFMSESLINAACLHFIIHNIELEPLPWDKKFDIILLTEVLEHFNFHPLPTLIKIRDSLSENGILCLSTPNAEFYGKVTRYYDSLEKIPFPESYNGASLVDDHVYVYEKVELLSILASAGLEVIADLSTRRHFQFILQSV